MDVPGDTKRSAKPLVPPPRTKRLILLADADNAAPPLACPSSEQSGRFEAAANGGFGASGFAV
jgi:hypothetical protein